MSDNYKNTRIEPEISDASKDCSDLRKTVRELEKLSEDETERQKIIAVARDRFFNNRLNQATKIEKVRAALIDGIVDDLENNKINSQQKLRFLEVLSKLNEADLNSLVGAAKPGGVTIFNSNNANIRSDVQEQAKTIKVVSKTGVELVKNSSDAQLLIDAVDAVINGHISTEEIKSIMPGTDFSENS